MRHCLTILAVCGLLMGPSLAEADDPFDFSGPLPTTSNRRTAQYFSRANEESGPEDQLRLEGSGEQSPYRRAARLPEKEPSSNYANELFGESPKQTVDKPKTVSFGADVVRERRAEPRERSAEPSRDPNEALRRFDEFLKTREVVPAGYSESADAAKPSAIRQVQLEEPQADDDLPSFGELDQRTPEVSFTPTKTSETATSSPFDVAEIPTKPSRHSLLTEPISTSPANVGVEQDASFSAAQPASKPETKTHSLQLDNFGTLTTNTGSTDGSSSYRDNAKTKEPLSAPAISAAWKLLDPLNIGQECRADLKLTNSGEADADRVSLEVRLPEHVHIVQADPAPAEEQNFLGWKLTGLAGGESQTIRVVFVATSPGPLDLATYVRHTSAQTESYTVSEPKLELTVSGPKEVHINESASQTLVVKNPGTGIATNVKIEALIPTGLEHATTGGRLRMDIGSLNPGEVRSVRLVMGAVTGGNQILQVQAVADAGLIQTANAEVTVIAPSLRVGVAGPSLRYLGREAEYTIRVLNDGSAATDYVQVNHQIPDGFDFVAAERGAKFDRASRNLNWYVGRLESSEKVDLKVTLLPKQIGDFVHAVRATSDVGAHAEAETTTKVQGAASLVLKVADLDDPVEVGAETAYEITITNEGTAAARDVGLTCEIPKGLTFLNAKGPSEHRHQGEMVGFRPVEELGAGQTLTFRVHISGEVAGDQRFRCRLTSEALTQPLFTEELTKFYGE